MTSPYQEALTIIERHAGTGGASGLAKLLLSLYNDECAFAWRECTRSLDESNQALALQIVTHFEAHGEDADLRRAGERLVELYPRLWDLGQAATDAKRALTRRWEDERRREDEAQEGDAA